MARMRRVKHREKYQIQYGNPPILGVAFTFRDLSGDGAKYANPVEGHVI